MRLISCILVSYQDNITPLYVACQEGHHDVVQTLLGAGADVNISTSDVSHAYGAYFHTNTPHTLPFLFYMYVLSPCHV